MNNVENEVERDAVAFDLWRKIWPYLDHINTISKSYYTPSQSVSIDESMIGMRNRVCFIQYMPNKRHVCFGIKKFEPCDNNGYMFHVDLYSGKDLDVHHNEGHAFYVVETSMRESDLFQKGYQLNTDNFYT